MDEKPRRVGIYCRISYNKTGEKKGVSRQEEDCRALSARRGWEVVEIYDDDDKSAWQPGVTRKNFDRLVADIGSGFIDGVVFYHMDRVAKTSMAFARLVTHYENDKQGRLVSDSVHGGINLADAQQRAIGALQAFLGGSESDATSRRMIDYYANEATHGRTYTNYPAFGWDSAGKLTIQAPIRAQMVLDIWSGSKCTTIANELNERGILTERGKVWHHSSVKLMVEAPRNVGWVIYRGQVLYDTQGRPIKGDWEPLPISEQVWQEAVAMLPRNTRTDQRIVGLLSNILVCGKCGKGMIRLRRSDTLFYYACRSKDSGGCAGVSINGPKMDSLIIRLVQGLLDGQTVQEESQPFPHQERLSQIARLKVEFMEAGARNDLPMAEVIRQVKKLEDEEKQLMGERTQHIKRQRRVMAISSELPGLPVLKQRAVIRTFIQAAVIAPSGRTGKFDPNRVTVVYAE